MWPSSNLAMDRFCLFLFPVFAILITLRVFNSSISSQCIRLSSSLLLSISISSFWVSFCFRTFVVDTMYRCLVPKLNFDQLYTRLHFLHRRFCSTVRLPYIHSLFSLLEREKKLSRSGLSFFLLGRWSDKWYLRLPWQFFQSNLPHDRHLLLWRWFEFLNQNTLHSLTRFLTLLQVPHQ